MEIKKKEKVNMKKKWIIAKLFRITQIKIVNYA